MEIVEDWMSPEEDALLVQALDALEEVIERETECIQHDEEKHDDTPSKQTRWKAVLKKDTLNSNGHPLCEIQDSEGKIEESSPKTNYTNIAKNDTVESHASQSGKGETDHVTINTEVVDNASTYPESNVNDDMGQLGKQDGNCTTNILKIDLELVEDVPIAETPLEIYRAGYLKVTDLTAQTWCEQQLVYSFSVPKEVLQTPAMERGTNMHLVKELEVYDIEEISVVTREDSWAVKFLNTYSALTQLISGSQKIREMPIFGEPFGLGVFFSGIIDEIRWNDKDQLELVEFKTRVKSKTLPSSAQRNTHKLQVSLYKHLFDRAVMGLFWKESFQDHLRLNLDKTLSGSVLDHTKNIGLKTDNLNGLVDKMLEKFQYLQFISCLTTEYTSQNDFTSFATESYEFDEQWLRRQVDNSLQFWNGKRDPIGVDIEDAWKCQHCHFQETCAWRLKMHEECVNKNSIKKVKMF